MTRFPLVEFHFSYIVFFEIDNFRFLKMIFLEISGEKHRNGSEATCCLKT
jgi:hypothetical protein